MLEDCALFSTFCVSAKNRRLIDFGTSFATVEDIDDRYVPIRVVPIVEVGDDSK